MQYQGQILDGQMHGTGKLTYENGEYYDGEWVRGNVLIEYFVSIFRNDDLSRYVKANDMEVENTSTMMGQSILATGRMI